MRLLKKQEIASLKAKEQAREIQEGVKIASKVDSLRELQATTEQNLEKYRRETLASVQKDIDIAIDRRDEIKKEILVLQDKLDAMLPGMETTRKELKKKEEYLEKTSLDIERRKEELSLAELDILEAKKEAKDTLARVKTLESAIALSAQKSAEYEEKTRKTLHSTTEAEKALLRRKNEQEMEFNERERAISTKEDILITQGVLLEKEKKELNAEKIKLADRRAMIERTMERLKKQRINVESVER